MTPDPAASSLPGPAPCQPRHRRRESGRGAAAAGLAAVVLLAHMALLGALPSHPGRERAVDPNPALSQRAAGLRPVMLLAGLPSPSLPAVPVVSPEGVDAVVATAAVMPAPAATATATATLATAPDEAPLMTRVALRATAARPVTPVALAASPASPPPALVAPEAAAMAPPPMPALNPAPTPAPAAELVAAAPPRAASAAALPAPTSVSTSAPAPAPIGAAEVPVYATRMPPAATLRYDLRRGALSGTGELRWRPAGNAYELDLAGSVLGIDVIGWSSRGGFDAAGIAPLRYVDRRRGKSAVAANFQRDAGRVTFSGPAVSYALLPGTQDRLSWMLQLPAIVEADPAHFRPGARIELYVVGAHGEADLWSFVVRGVQAVEVPAGRLDAALFLQREPQRAYDTRVDIWLDPARHHLPARARLTTMPSGDALELLLRQSVTE